MRRLTLLLPVLLAFLAPATRAEPDRVAWLEPGTLANVVYVRAGDSAGSAFLLRYRDELFLVTARHVVEGALEDTTIPVEFLIGGKHGRPIRKTRLLRESRRSDLAVYQFEEDPNVPYFHPGAGLVPHTELHLASQVFLVGYPANLWQTYGATELRVVGGWVAGTKKYVPGSTVEYVDIDMSGVEHGHSGGPILQLQDRVIAVAVQRRSGSVSDTIGATYAVPIKYVTALIEDQPVLEDVNALNETLRGTTLLCGIAVQGKNDFDIWSQRVHRDTGEGVWGDMGIFVASSLAQEGRFVLLPSDDGSSLVVHSAVYPADGDSDILVQKVSKYGELLFQEGRQSRPVAITDRKERAPAAVSDGADGAIVAYEVLLDGGDVDIVAQRVAPDGRLLWEGPGIGVASANVPERAPAIVSDGAGGAIVVFTVFLQSGDTDIMAQRIRPDGTLAWHDGARSATVASAEAMEGAPRVVSDGEGGAIVVYEFLLEDAGHRVVLAQRVSPHGELLWNEGKRGVLLTALGLAPGPDAIAVIPDGRGGAFVAMEILADEQNAEDVDIALQRIAPDGTLVWGGETAGDLPAPVLAASSTWAERRPVLHEDGQGGVVVAFETSSAQGDLDVMAQRVDGEGRLRWHQGERSAEVAYTRLGESRPRIADRDRDRILVLFEVRHENGRNGVACQALAIEDGHSIYGGGRYPIGILDPGETDLNYHLAAPVAGD